MKKKLLSLLLCVVLVVSLSIPALAANKPSYKTVSGTYTYCPSLGFLDIVGNSQLSFQYSDEWFTKSAYKYNHALATTSMALTQCSFAAADSATDFSDAWKNAKDLLTQCGFVKFMANNDAKTMPGGHTIGAVAASKPLVDNGGNYTLIALGIRGHNYGQEWASNFLVGSEGDHVGFVDARDKVLSFLRQYIASMGITGRVKIWTTGFSRGAATANMLSAQLDNGIDLGNGVTTTPHDVYCYTFETPQGTVDPNARAPIYRNIKNIMNPNDLVPLVGPDAWGFSRYGEDYFVPCRQKDANYQPMADAMWKELSSMGWSRFYLIDDFHYLTLQGENKDITQLEYFDLLFDAMFKSLAPSRQAYVDNLQADLMELSASLLGFHTSQIMKGLMNFAGNLVAGDLLKAAANPLNLANVLEQSLIEALNRAGVINYDNAEQVNAMVKNLVQLMLPFIVANPELAVNLVLNLMQIINAHFSEVTNAWLRSLPASYMEAQTQPFQYSGLYKDVNTGNWFVDEVDYVTYGKMMNGMSEGMFVPNRNTTRAEFVTVLYRLEGEPAANGVAPFVDVKRDSWYANAVNWAYANGVVDGMTATTFAPNQNITREQMVTMLQRYASRVGDCTGSASALNGFTDASRVSSWAKEAMQWAVQTGTVQGMTDTTLVPQGVVTRAQIAALMNQFCES